MLRDMRPFRNGRQVKLKCASLVSKKPSIICAYLRSKSDSVYLIKGSFHSEVDRFFLGDGEMQKAVRDTQTLIFRPTFSGSTQMAGGAGHIPFVRTRDT